MVSGHRPIAIDVAVDHAGNAYVTNPVGNFIWKVEPTGKPSVLSMSAIFSSQHMYTRQPYSLSGLNGIAYVSKSFLLVVQTNTGKLFKVNADDGTVRVVRLTEDLTAADRIAVRNDGVVVVMSKKKAWFLKSKDGWEEAVVYDEIALDVDKLPTSITVGEETRTYVLYGRVRKGSLGSIERREFSIEEIIGSGEGKKEEAVGKKNVVWSMTDSNASLCLSFCFHNKGHICDFDSREDRAKFQCSFTQDTYNYA
ncbi:uncharacterized protein LOC122645108 [Telopea speciosissima]|uniref:uncharacterized protein LOC122645108 n=1 Tax=Telopea speciosissima TaxID=54955 RepID=UPI001CC821C1|nr:uncharacterized protein LOC122645108 [Telopea speciosissima]